MKKTYQRVAAICISIGLLVSTASLGVEGGELITPSGVQGEIGHDDVASSMNQSAKFLELGNKYSFIENAAGDDEAAYYYRKAAQLGNARAQISLGMMYANGRGVRKDFDEAIYWIHQASRLGQLSWHDMLVTEAISWLQEASRHGYTPAKQTLDLMQASANGAVVESDKSIFWMGLPVAPGYRGQDGARHKQSGLNPA